MDVTIHNALLDQTLEEVDLGIKNGKIIKISSDELEKGEEYIDAKGCLVVPPFFGFIDALQMQLQAVGVDLPFQLFLAMPYMLTVIAVFLGRKRSGAPIALGLHYVRE